MIVWIAAALTVGLAWLITGVARRYALARSILDVPNQRSSHRVPTPRGGGLAIVCTFLLWVLALYLLQRLNWKLALALLAGGIATAAVGFADDHRPVRARVRFATHLGASLLAVWLLGGIPEAALRVVGLHGALAGGIAGVALLTWCINLFNFMDGIDGIAASEAAFFALGGAALNWLARGDASISALLLALAAGSLGFLLWNWPPAKIFMGDIGSGFLGFVLGTFALTASQHDTMPIETWAILGGVFFVDATVTLIRRMSRGERWFAAHRTHAYQHLQQRMSNHAAVTITVIGINLVWLLPFAVLTIKDQDRVLLYFAAALAPLALAVWLVGAGVTKE